MSERETCCVADQFCTAAANFAFPAYVRGRCKRCGLAVCSECSTMRKYLQYGFVRLCNDCQVDFDGNDKLVMKRMRRKAGIQP